VLLQHSYVEVQTLSTSVCDIKRQAFEERMKLKWGPQGRDVTHDECVLMAALGNGCSPFWKSVWNHTTLVSVLTFLSCPLLETSSHGNSPCLVVSSPRKQDIWHFPFVLRQQTLMCVHTTVSRYACHSLQCTLTGSLCTSMHTWNKETRMGIWRNVLWRASFLGERNTGMRFKKRKWALTGQGKHFM
jgi:hypothetical protein